MTDVMGFSLKYVVLEPTLKRKVSLTEGFKISQIDLQKMQ